MAGVRSGLRPAAVGGILAAVFAASVGVSTAASMSLSSGPDETATAATTDASATTNSGSVASNSNSPSADASSAAQDDSDEREIKQVTKAPRTASKNLVKKSKDALCKASPGNLPKITFGSGAVQWIKTLEALASDRGLEPGAIDGIYNVQTRNAIRGFEESFGTAVNGVMETDDWQALWDDLCAPDPVYVPAQPAYTPPSNGGGSSGGGGGGGLNRLD